MKHILPILTAALALTATTASAALVYDYSYYEKSDVKDVVVDTEHPDNFNRVKGYQTIDYDSYQVLKEGTFQQQGSVTYQSAYKIHVSGTKVDFYLTDVVDNIGSSTDSSALADRGITQIGYRILDSKDESKIGKTGFSSLDDAFNSSVTGDFVYAGQTVTGVRNIYYLGSFSEGDEFELYMSRDEVGQGGAMVGPTGVWSYSDGANGGYYGGNYGLPYSQTDQWVLSEYNNDAAKANRAMPLAALDPGIPDYSTVEGNRASFGVYAVGSPLPGGLQIALVAGLFGLGFWYFRRRKAAAV